jgi:hypothetical protein
VALLTLLQFVHLKYEFLLEYEFFYFLFDKQIASRHSYWTAQIKETNVERIKKKHFCPYRFTLDKILSKANVMLEQS